MNLPSITKLCIVAMFFSSIPLYGMKYFRADQEFQKLIEEDEKEDSSCRVLIINGPSSSGKTLICKGLKRRFSNVRFISMDSSYPANEAALACRGARELMRKGLEEEHLVLLKRIGECAQNTDLVVCDAVLLNQDYGDISSTFCQTLEKAGYTVIHVLVYCPLPMLLQQAVQRKVDKKEDINARNVLDVALQFLHFYSLKPPSWKIDDYVVGDCLRGSVLAQQLSDACGIIDKRVPRQTGNFFKLESKRWLEDVTFAAKTDYNLYSMINCDRIFYNDPKHPFSGEIEKIQILLY